VGDKIMYRDREKQKETTKLRVRRYRDKLKGVTEKVDNVTPCVTPIIKTKADAVEAVQKISKDWRTPKAVGCRRFGENPEST
jgi:hypothetical protein